MIFLARLSAALATVYRNLLDRRIISGTGNLYVGWTVSAIILLVAFFTRLPLVLNPDSTIADEFLYANFATLVARGTPLFDIHPPLARILFAAVLSHYDYTVHYFQPGIGVLFGDFPFHALRSFVLVFGTLLPLLLYHVGRRIGYPIYGAGCIALFAICDNALTLYGAVILPDTILLFFNMLALFAALIAVDTKSTRTSWIATICSGITLGAAFAIKWTALGMLVPLVLLYVLTKNQSWKKPFMIILLCMITYVAIFIYYFTLFTPANVPPAAIVPYDTMQGVRALRFPENHSLTKIISFLPAIHIQMKEANTSSEIVPLYTHVPPRITWPTGQSKLYYWIDSATPPHLIIFMGNSFLWVTLFLLLFYVFYLMFKRKRVLIKSTFSSWGALRSYLAQDVQNNKDRETSVFRFQHVSRRNMLILVVGYFSNYLPFFLIERPMYLYHYFTSLLFLLLLSPLLMSVVAEQMMAKIKDRRFVRAFFFLFVVVIVVCYALLLPYTYGY